MLPSEKQRRWPKRTTGDAIANFVVWVVLLALVFVIASKLV